MAKTTFRDIIDEVLNLNENGKIDESLNLLLSLGESRLGKKQYLEIQRLLKEFKQIQFEQNNSVKNFTINEISKFIEIYCDNFLFTFEDVTEEQQSEYTFFDVLIYYFEKFKSFLRIQFLSKKDNFQYNRNPKVEINGKVSNDEFIDDEAFDDSSTQDLSKLKKYLILLITFTPLIYIYNQNLLSCSENSEENQSLSPGVTDLEENSSISESVDSLITGDIDIDTLGKLSQGIYLKFNVQKCKTIKLSDLDIIDSKNHLILNYGLSYPLDSLIYHKYQYLNDFKKGRKLSQKDIGFCLQ